MGDMKLFPIDVFICDLKWDTFQEYLHTNKPDLQVECADIQKLYKEEMEKICKGLPNGCRTRNNPISGTESEDDSYNRRCGKDLDDATSRCGKLCNGDSSCPSGEKCFSQLPTTCPGESLPRRLLRDFEVENCLNQIKSVRVDKNGPTCG